MLQFSDEAIKHSLAELSWPFLRTFGALSTFKVLVLVTSITADIEVFLDFLTGRQESGGLVVQLAIEVVAEAKHALITSHKFKLLEAFTIIEVLFHQLLHVEAVPELTCPGIFNQHLAAFG